MESCISPRGNVGDQSGCIAGEGMSTIKCRGQPGVASECARRKCTAHCTSEGFKPEEDTELSSFWRLHKGERVAVRDEIFMSRFFIDSCRHGDANVHNLAELKSVFTHISVLCRLLSQFPPSGECHKLTIAEPRDRVKERPNDLS
jgi:hypothetical protein